MAQKIKRHFLRTFGFAAILLMVFSSVVPGMISKIQVAHAAAGAGTATINIGTGGTSASDAAYGGAAATGSVTVGTKSYVLIDLTVGAGNITADQNNVTVQINTNLFPATTWDVNEEAALTDLTTVGTWFVGYTDTDSATTNNGAISFSASAAVNTGLITIQANQKMDATDIIHIYGVVQDNNYTRAMADVVVKTDDTGANDLTQIGTGVSPRIATSAADAAATVAKATPTSGSTGALTLTLNTARSLIVGDKINITFPAAFYTVAATTATIAASAITNNGSSATLNVTAPGSNVLTLTVATETLVGGTNTGITIPGVDAIPQYVASTDITTFTVQTSSGVNIATDSDVTLTDTITEGALSSASVTPGSLVAGATPANVIAFTTTTPIPNLGKIVVTYPLGFDVSGADGRAATSLSGLDGTWTATYSGRVVTFTQTAGGASAAGAKSLTVAGIKNPPVTGETGTYTITTKIAAGSNIDTNAAVGASTITAGALSSTNVEPDSLVVGSSAVNTITFTTANPIPNAGTIIVTYPSGFGVSGANGVVATNLSGLDGVWTATTSGQVVTLTQVGGGISAAGAKSLRIANIVTPGTPGTTGTYTITTKSPSVNIDTDAAVTADTVVSGSSSDSGGGGGVVGDTTPPTNVSVAIVGAPKVPTSNVQLTLAATGATEMLISNVSDFGSASWETYNTVKNWTLLSGTGAKSVYVKFRDAAHNTSSVVQANVTVDVAAPAPVVVQVPVVPVVQQPTPGVSFLDIATHWAKDYIVQLSQMGVIQGRTPGSYEPDGLLTRAEMVKIALLTFGYKIDNANTKSFSDVDAAIWFAPYIALAKAQGIVGGYEDGTFKPNASITRAEALKILLVAAKKNLAGAAAAVSFVDVDQAAWYANYVNYAFAKAVVNGKDATHFAPADFITRAEMAKIAILTFQIK
ncbi:MAG: S-layer homology domain-containing protein [Candidatus Gracilibacteria bacterium]|jgi:hypothetical protein